MEQRELHGDRSVAQPGDADRSRVDHAGGDRGVDPGLDEADDRPTLRPMRDIDALRGIEAGRALRGRQHGRPLKTEHREPARRQQVDRDIVPGPAAQETATDILDHDQRDALAGPTIWRQRQIAIGGRAVARKCQAANLAEASCREVRIGIEQGRDRAARGIERDDRTRMRRCLMGADQRLPHERAAEQRIGGIDHALRTASAVQVPAIEPCVPAIGGAACGHEQQHAGVAPPQAADRLFAGRATGALAPADSDVQLRGAERCVRSDRRGPGGRAARRAREQQRAAGFVGLRLRRHGARRRVTIGVHEESLDRDRKRRPGPVVAQWPEAAIEQEAGAALGIDRGLARNEPRPGLGQQAFSVRGPAKAGHVGREPGHRAGRFIVEPHHPELRSPAIATEIGDPAAIWRPEWRAGIGRAVDDLGGIADIVRHRDELAADVEQPRRLATVERDQRHADAIAVAVGIGAPHRHHRQPPIGRHAERRLALETAVGAPEIEQFDQRSGGDRRTCGLRLAGQQSCGAVRRRGPDG